MRSHPCITASVVVFLCQVLVAQDECSTAANVIDGVNGPFNNLTATTSSGWPCGSGGNDLWYQYIATCNGAVTFSTCTPARNFDTVIEVLDGAGGCANLVSLACNDDICMLGSGVTVGAAGGQLFFVRVGGFSGDVGTFELVVSCAPGGPTNDECAGASPLALGLNTGFSNFGSSTSGPAWQCTGANDLWYSYVATCTAPHTFNTCSGGASLFDTTLEVFSGPCTNLVSLGCDDDTCFPQSQVVVNLTQGTTYRLRVGGYLGLTGSYDVFVAIGTNGGSMTNLGLGCGPTTIALTGYPNINGSFTTTLGNVTGLPFIGVGFVGNNTPFCVCNVGHDWAATNFGTSVTIAIPCAPTLIGLNAFVQGADLLGTGGCPSPPITLTDTWQVVIG